MRVSIDPVKGSVHIDGCDISASVRRVTLDKHNGRQSEVFLELIQGAEVDVLEDDAVVTVVREAEDNPAVVIRSWLDGIDPSVLERAVLEHDGGLGDSTGQMFLDVLRGWVSGG